MAGFGFSPTDVVEFCKFSHRAYKEARNAPARYAAARELANRTRVLLDEIPLDGDQVGPATRGLTLHLELANKAYKDLDEYLGLFQEHLDQQARSTVAASRVVARVRWTTDQLDKKVDKLQDAVQSAIAYCGFAVISQLSARVQATLDMPTADVMNAESSNTLEPATVVQAEMNVDQQLCWQRRGGCRCRCHHRSEFSGSFISWLFDGLANSLSICNLDKDECNSRRYVLSLRVALSRLGIPVAVIPSLQLIINPDYRLQILPSLQMQRTCKYTSRGFLALYMLEQGGPPSDRNENDEQYSARFVTYKQNKLAEIKQLFREEKVSHLDVDPSGATWLEKLLETPWGIGIRWAQYDLLEYLVSRSKKDIQQNPRLLFQIARWIGEGPHIDMLTTLIGLGLDPSSLDPSLFRQWPAFSNPNYQVEVITPDPFGIDFLRQCLEKEPGEADWTIYRLNLHADIQPEFARCNLLMTCLLTGSDQEFEEAAQKWATSGRACYINAFGQSALHLAVIYPKRLRKLLELGMRPNVGDLGDTTPLMYAAAYGKSESVLDLIDYGSNVDSQDTLNRRFFIDYALVHRNMDLIAELVEWLRAQGGHDLASDLLGRCIHFNSAQCCSVWSDSDTLDRLFRLCGDSDIILGSKTCMHLARDIRDARVVLRHGFTAVDVMDEGGETALMRVSQFLDTRLLYKILDIEATAGISIDRQDKSGWSVLMHLTNCMDERNSHQPKEALHLNRASAVGCLNMLVSRGASPTLTDECNCPCSPQGCSALSVALHQAVESIVLWRSFAGISITALDFAIALQTCTDSSTQWAIDTVRTFVDFLETGELHTCCARRRVRSALFPPSSDCSTSTNARTQARLPSSAGINPGGGLHFQLARLYDVLQRRSQAQHDAALARRIHNTHVNKRKPRPSGLVVDTVRDNFYYPSVVCHLPIPDVLHLDTHAYRGWIAWCVDRTRQLYSRKSLEPWAKEASIFVDRLEEELDSLSQRY